MLVRFIVAALLAVVPAHAVDITLAGTFERAAPASEFSAPGGSFELSFTLAEPQPLNANDDVDLNTANVSGLTYRVNGVDVLSSLSAALQPGRLTRQGSDGTAQIQFLLGSGFESRGLSFNFLFDMPLFDLAFVSPDLVPVFINRTTTIASGGLSVCSLGVGNCANNTPETVARFFDGTATTAVAGVPEPATWSLLIGGFALVGAAARRARNSQRTA